MAPLIYIDRFYCLSEAVFNEFKLGLKICKFYDPVDLTPDLSIQNHLKAIW